MEETQSILVLYLYIELFKDTKWKYCNLFYQLPTSRLEVIIKKLFSPILDFTQVAQHIFTLIRVGERGGNFKPPVGFALITQKG